jgi:hypothetical protein
VKAVAGFDERFVVCQNCAAFAGVQILARLKAETAGSAVRAHFPATPLGKVRLTRVFDDRDAASAPDLHDRVEIGGRAAEVDGHDDASFAGNRLLHLPRVDLEGVDVAVDEHRKGMHQQHGIHRGDEGVGRDDDLVARSDAERGQRRDDRARAVGRGEAVLRTRE